MKKDCVPLNTSMLGDVLTTNEEGCNNLGTESWQFDGRSQPEKLPRLVPFPQGIKIGKIGI